MTYHSVFRLVLAGSALGAALALAACGASGTSSPASVLPQGARDGHNQAKRLSQCPCLYVVNRTFRGSGTPSVTVYPASAAKDARPIESISGAATELESPWGVALDSSNNLYVTSTGSNSVNIYPAWNFGNVAPLATIAGPNTAFDEPAGIALDANNNIYVGNYSNSTVAVFPSGSSGNVSPSQLIAGSNTGLNFPEGIAVDADGDIFVANSKSNSITVYAAGATGNASPMRQISGSATGLNLPTGVALDGDGNIYVANYAATSIAPSVEVFAAGSNGNVSPVATISGKKTKLDDPYGVALDASGNLHVANDETSTVAAFASGTHGDAKPTLLKGKKTGLDYPLGIFIR